MGTKNVIVLPYDPKWTNCKSNEKIYLYTNSFPYMPYIQQTQKLKCETHYWKEAKNDTAKIISLLVMLLFKLQTNPIMNMTESLRILDIFEKVLGLICIAPSEKQFFRYRSDQHIKNTIVYTS